MQGTVLVYCFDTANKHTSKIRGGRAVSTAAAGAYSTPQTQFTQSHALRTRLEGLVSLPLHVGNLHAMAALTTCLPPWPGAEHCREPGGEQRDGCVARLGAVQVNVLARVRRVVIPGRER